MKNKYCILILAFFICLAIKASAQSAKNQKGSSGGNGYTTGIGLRGGWEGGLTVKHFISDGRAVEGILSRGWGWGGFRITGLY